MSNVGVTIILAIQILSALVMTGLILVQHGKGADMGASFGTGSAGSLFGSAGSSNFLSKATGGFATVFFVCTLGLAYLGGSFQPKASGGVMETLSAPASKPSANQIPGGAVPAAVTSSKPIAGASSAASAAVPPAAAISAATSAASAASTTKANDIPK